MKYRKKLNFNQDWKFICDNEVNASQRQAEDKLWKEVSLPHTPRIETLHIDMHFQGICWYRKHFIIPKEDKGKKLFVEFEAAMQEADVWVNGIHKLTHKGGFLPFTIDMTEDVEYGASNVIAVRLNNCNNGSIPPGKPLESLDFSYFGGLYRNVYLHVTDKLHVTDAVHANVTAGGGIFVKYSNVSRNSATINVDTHVRNDYDSTKLGSVITSIVDHDNNVVAVANSTPEMIPGHESCTFVQSLTVLNPQLWHPDTPHLYLIRTQILHDQKPVDDFSTRIGIRTLSFSKQNGFVINGDKLVIRGTNRHQQFPHIGHAASDNAHYRDARKLKEGGYNFVRLGHYPQSPAFLEACDELGLMVVEPVPGWQYCEEGQLQELVRQHIRDMIRRDRNHPCVIMWEVSLNETHYSRSGATDEFFRECHLIAHEEFPGDQMFTAGDTMGRKDAAFVGYDVPYTLWKGEDLSRPLEDVLPDKSGFDREYGDYEFGGHDSTSRVPRNAGEAKLLQQAWNYQWSLNRNRSNHWSLGDASWVGIDHNRGCFPRAAECGALDSYRLPKFVYYFYKSQRKPDIIHTDVESGPVIFIANYWTERTSPAKVVVFSNCDEVELFVNGKSTGLQRPDAGVDTAYGEVITGFEVDYWLTDVEQHKHKENDNRVTTLTEAGELMVSPHDGGNCVHLEQAPFTFHNIDYEPGTLKAVGRIGGVDTAVAIVRTPLAPESLSIQCDFSGKDLTADGSDFIFVYVKVLDANGTVVPTAEPELCVEIEGPALVINPGPIRAEAGIATIMLQSRPIPGIITISVSADKLLSAVEKLTSVI